MMVPDSSHQWQPQTDAAYQSEAEDLLGADLAACFGKIQLLVFDIDGVMTSGKILYGVGGETYKEFHTRDGLGLVMCRIVGLKLAALTGRDSAIVDQRCKELRFHSIKLGRFDKLAAFTEILAENSCQAQAALYMGDDLIDLPVLSQVGLAISVPAAPDEVKDQCQYVTRAQGGQGAVREVTDLVLKSAGRFGLAVDRLGDKTWLPKPPVTARGETTPEAKES